MDGLVGTPWAGAASLALSIVRPGHHFSFNRVIGPNPYSFADIRANPILAVTNMDYYYFDIASTNVVSATVSLFPFIDPRVAFNGDVNLVLRRALPVVSTRCKTRCSKCRPGRLHQWCERRPSEL